MQGNTCSPMQSDTNEIVVDLHMYKEHFLE